MPENKKPATQDQDQEQPKSLRPSDFLTSTQQRTSRDISLGLQADIAEIVKSDGKIAIEQSVEVILSPHHAKALLGVLASHVTEYEKQVGEIKLQTLQSAPASKASQQQQVAGFWHPPFAER